MGYVTAVMIPIWRNTGYCAPNTRQRGRLSTRIHAKRVPAPSLIIVLAGVVPVGQLVWGVHCRSSYHYDHITRTGSAAATTTSPRTPPTPPPSCQKGHTRTPHTPRTLSTFHLGGLQLCLLARRTTVGRFLSLRPGFPLWTSTAPHHATQNLGRLVADGPCSARVGLGPLPTSQELPNVAAYGWLAGCQPVTAVARRCAHFAVYTTVSRSLIGTT